MKRLILFLLFAIPVLGQTVNIPIQNPSFESPVNLGSPGLCGRGFWGPIPGWQSTQAPGGSFGVIDWTCVTVPDGVAVAFLGNASTSQDLKITPQVGTYVLKFWVANWFYKYPGDYYATLTINGKALCSTSGIADGDFQEITLVCPAPPHVVLDHWQYPPGNLGISFSSGLGAGPVVGWPILLDKVSLTFTPTN